MNFKQAIKRGRERGVTRQQLCEALYPNVPFENATHNLANLINGKSKKVDIDAVPTICKLCGVSADYLFGLTDNPEGADFAEVRKAILDAMDASENALNAVNKINLLFI